MTTHFIAGDYIKSSGTATRKILNPGDGQVVDAAPRGSVEDANDAVQAAKAVVVKRWEWGGVLRIA